MVTKKPILENAIEYIRVNNAQLIKFRILLYFYIFLGNFNRSAHTVRCTLVPETRLTF